MSEAHGGKLPISVVIQSIHDPQRVYDWLGEGVITALETIKVEWVAPHGLPGIMAATFATPSGDVRI